MTQQTWLLTGTSRGIGLEMIKHLLARGYNVIGTCRNPDGARDHWELAAAFGSRFQSLKLDVADPKSIEVLAGQLAGKTIDVLVNNAGVLKGAGEGLLDLKIEDVIRSFEVNVAGPMRVTRSLMGSLRRSKDPKVINITSRMGSISDNESGGYYGYRMSKTALNMFNKCLSREFTDVTCVVVHPGWVKTEMGGPQAPLEAHVSAEGIVKVVTGLARKDSGRFVDYRGEEIEW